MNKLFTIFLPIFGGIICAFIGALGTYMAVKRKNSGLIETSEAADLWSESKSIRQELRNENTTLRERIKTLEESMTERDKQIFLLSKRITELENHDVKG